MGASEPWRPYTDEEWEAAQRDWEDGHHDAAELMENLTHERETRLAYEALLRRALDHSRHEDGCLAGEQAYPPDESGACAQEHVDCSCWKGEAWDAVTTFQVVTP